ncbi:MAG: Type secretion system family protein, partial [Actinomycetota bacterium]|nr:Type secretion system family protein [Actinomycetota bacterium]
MTVGLPVALLAGMAAALGVAAIWEAFAGPKTEIAGPGLRAWFVSTIEPLRRARLEGYLPTSDERFRLALLFGLAAIAGGWWLAGPAAGAVLAVGAPLVAGWLISRG